MLIYININYSLSEESHQDGHQKLQLLFLLLNNPEHLFSKYLANILRLTLLVQHRQSAYPWTNHSNPEELASLLARPGTQRAILWRKGVLLGLQKQASPPESVFLYRLAQVPSSPNSLWLQAVLCAWEVLESSA